MDTAVADPGGVEGITTPPFGSSSEQNILINVETIKEVCIDKRKML